MGRHSRKGSEAKGAGRDARPADPYASAPPADPYASDGYGPGGPGGPGGSQRSGAHDTGELETAASGRGTGRRRRAVPGAEHTVSGQGPARTRGGHPEQHEAGGGWGVPPSGPRVGSAPTAPASGSRIPGPRREFVDAFDGRRPPEGPDAGSGPTSGSGGAAGDKAARRPASGGVGRTVTGIVAAAVTTVLAVVVAGQVASDTKDKPKPPTSGQERSDDGSGASRSDSRQSPAQAAKPAPPTYETLMATRFPIDPKLTADGTFRAVAGFDKAPGPGRKIRYRVDIESGLAMDGALFATAVQRTLNDDRSWAHGGAMSFERISSGEPEFVITLASPGTTDIWCAKSGLNTSIGNVSCDSASTDRVMINAFRWAQGSETYGPRAMHAYRQMLINHEVGHRLGHGHVNCDTKGALAPVMQQQTKSLNIGGISCRPNAWVHPGS